MNGDPCAFRGRIGTWVPSTMPGFDQCFLPAGVAISSNGVAIDLGNSNRVTAGLAAVELAGSGTGVSVDLAPDSDVPTTFSGVKLQNASGTVDLFAAPEFASLGGGSILAEVYSNGSFVDSFPVSIAGTIGQLDDAGLGLPRLTSVAALEEPGVRFGFAFGLEVAGSFSFSGFESSPAIGDEVRLTVDNGGFPSGGDYVEITATGLPDLDLTSITAVPEPATSGLAFFAVLLSCSGLRHMDRRKPIELLSESTQP